MPQFEKVTFYSWGVQATSSYPASSNWSIYIPAFLEGSFSGLIEQDEIKTYAVPLIVSILILPFSLLALIFGIISEEKLSKNNRYLCNYAGFLSMFSAILFYIFIQFGVFSTSAGLTMSLVFNWSFGFGAIVVSTVIFFISFLAIGKLDVD